eukprot:gene11737-15703_t
MEFNFNTDFKSSTISIPIIDISKLRDGSVEERLTVANEIGKACKEIGFFIAVGHNVNITLIESVWNSTKDFFDLPIEQKLEVQFADQSVYPFGYSQLGGEILSAGKAVESGQSKQMQLPDLKEMFSIGPADPIAGFPARIFPQVPIDFSNHYTEYYEVITDLAKLILRGFALALKLPDEYFFEKYCTHHASAIRALNYPAIPDPRSIPKGQTRASAHTDYGAITILKSDGPGLQVSKDKDPPNWVDVPYIENGFIINLGDLMKRWTNDYWLSTLHRVIIPQSEYESSIANDEIVPAQSTKRRQSIAFFFNINRDALVDVIMTNPDDQPKYEPIIAGEFLMQKHLASLAKN